MPTKDVLLVMGLVMVGTGCWLVSPALALIVVGTIFMATGVVAHFRDLRRK